MNRNQLKLIACIAMTIDHIGYIIFPDVLIFRIIGRIAMPVFAFFIGEGCRYTKDRKKYFLRLFVLGIICQLVYIAESLITNSGKGLNLNILFTFSFSIILCCAFLDFKKDANSKNRNRFIVCLVSLLLMCLFFEKSAELIGFTVTLDYGFYGICLPLFALFLHDEKKKKLLYALGTVIFAFLTYGGINLFFFSTLFSSVLLCLYNGKSGKAKLKYFFYLFYPVHLLLIYGADMLIHL